MSERFSAYAGVDGFHSLRLRVSASAVPCPHFFIIESPPNESWGGCHGRRSSCPASLALSRFALTTSDERMINKPLDRAVIERLRKFKEDLSVPMLEAGYLDLSGTSIDDAGLVHLKGMELRRVKP